VRWFENLFDARSKVGAWRKDYNEEPPYSSSAIERQRNLPQRREGDRAVEETRERSEERLPHNWATAVHPPPLKLNGQTPYEHPANFGSILFDSLVGCARSRGGFVRDAATGYLAVREILRVRSTSVAGSPLRRWLRHYWPRSCWISHRA
jgi:hypothetical protein